MQLYGLLRRLERPSNLKTQVFIYNDEEDFAKIFLFYFNKICNVLSKVQQGSNQLNILVGCNLSFINASYLEMDG